MGLASLVGLDANALGARFSLVSLLPTSTGVLVVGFVVAAGAPGSSPSWDEALRTARDMDATDVGLLAVAVLVIAALLLPLQLQLVRTLEGYWGQGRVARWLSGPFLRRHRKVRARLADRAQLAPGATTVPEEAAVADQLLRARYPREPLLPTALGNALRAAERRAGRRYGLDAVVLWPRLYPLVDERQRTVLEDRRDQLDLAARMTATFALAGVVTFGLLWRYPAWWVFPLAVLALSALSYRAATASAIAYGESLDIAFDLHRFDLLTALHLPLPVDNASEREQNQRLSTWLRQGGPPPASYRHPE